MELLTEITIENLVIGKPKQTKSGSKISTVVYRKDDGSVIKPVFQTPRVRIHYGARKFDDAGSYTYCISFATREIDPEIDAFAELVDMIDDHLNKTETSISYRRSITTPANFMKLGMIQDRDGVLTTINRTDGRPVRPEQLTYGMYSDQYITLDSIIYTDSYFAPIWKAHQIIVSPHEKVFLSVCLLDQFKDQQSSSGIIPSLPSLPFPAQLALPPPPAKPSPAPAPAATKFQKNTSLASLISPDMLKSHIEQLKLRKTNESNDSPA